jgi:hypothetical protein
MPSTYSTSLKLQLIGTGEQAGVWGTTTNYNLGTLLEQAITGVVTIPMGDATYTLTNFNGLSDEARNAVLILNGPITSPQFLVAPAGQQKVYIVRNRTGNTVTLTTGTGSNISVANAASEVLFTDGANVYSATQFNYVSGDLTVTGTATANNLVATNNITLGKDLFANSSTGQFYLPVGNSAVRTTSPIEGLIRYNSELDFYEGYSNSTWVRFQTYPQGVYTITYITVAGGGGGGSGGGGGGGAGGLIASNRSVDPGTVLTIIVGAGGAAATAGSQSSLTGTVTAVGGGLGSNAYGNGGNGGSGGGGGNGYYGGGSPGTGTSGQGTSGGSAAGVPGNSAGGGGGGGGQSVAGSNGLGNPYANGGAGGTGYYTTITGTAEYYAGGGGGGSGPNGDSLGGSGGAGGAGGGGNGGTYPGDNATAGTINTGGGGGGGTNAQGGKAGGSGVVILSIPTAYYSGVYTGAPTIFTAGANTIVKFTASGTYTA